MEIVYWGIGIAGYFLMGFIFALGYSIISYRWENIEPEDFLVILLFAFWPLIFFIGFMAGCIFIPIGFIKGIGKLFKNV